MGPTLGTMGATGEGDQTHSEVQNAPLMHFTPWSEQSRARFLGEISTSPRRLQEQNIITMRNTVSETPR